MNTNALKIASDDDFDKTQHLLDVPASRSRQRRKPEKDKDHYVITSRANL